MNEARVDLLSLVGVIIALTILMVFCKREHSKITNRFLGILREKDEEIDKLEKNLK